MALNARREFGLAAAAAAFLPLKAFAAAAGESGPMVIVADTRRLSGFGAWCGNLYNEGPLYLTLAAIIIIPVTGLILSALTSFVMSRTGIDLKSRAPAER